MQHFAYHCTHASCLGKLRAKMLQPQAGAETMAAVCCQLGTAMYCYAIYESIPVALDVLHWHNVVLHALILVSVPDTYTAGANCCIWYRPGTVDSEVQPLIAHDRVRVLLQSTPGPTVVGCGVVGELET